MDLDNMLETLINPVGLTLLESWARTYLTVHPSLSNVGLNSFSSSLPWHHFDYLEGCETSNLSTSNADTTWLLSTFKELGQWFLFYLFWVEWGFFPACFLLHFVFCVGIGFCIYRVKEKLTFEKLATIWLWKLSPSITYDAISIFVVVCSVYFVTLR